MTRLEDLRSDLDESDAMALERARARLRAAQANSNVQASSDPRRRRVLGDGIRVAVAACTAIAVSVAVVLVGVVSTNDGGLGPAPADARAVLAHAAESGIKIVSDVRRTVPAPTSAGADAVPWTLIPTVDGGTCGSTSRLVFCGDEDAVEAGRASATEYPPDTNPRRDDSGRWIVTPSDGAGVRAGVAPPRATHVVVVDRDGHEVRRESVQRGVYEIAVPPQGTASTVEFRDPSGAVVAVRPAEG